ncbi:hypothetical protein K431DRAFT_233079 [Polychaeton citri CBS 116435]|uniref:ferric-chelate reductase (NADPH) n=1 Tax=Polychaeton citri CBS 116435 TaxID=1314669 RepID=A0A9P4ULZ2_9PEZI|nr:hypothetical protein K431DRAFT_233079 [Polychaeton citri CBS 116435]
MPSIAELLTRRSGIPENTTNAWEEAAEMAEENLPESLPLLAKRINVACCNPSSPSGLIEANTIDPWSKSGKYALGWVYFSVILLVLAVCMRAYYLFSDSVRTAIREDENDQAYGDLPGTGDYEMSALRTDRSTHPFFPREHRVSINSTRQLQASVSSIGLINNTIASVRFVIYRPIPSLRFKKGWRPIVFPSLAVACFALSATAFTICYCFIPQPLYWASIQFGSPPLAVRAGMLAVAMMPWIVALSMKASLIAMLTGIGHERLNVLHRWLAWLCLLLSLIHTIPFYVTPVWDEGGMLVFKSYFSGNGIAIYGTGIAALVPLIFLCVHSLPVLRRKFYEVFVVIHVPVSIVFLGMLFWHCNNYLTSWSYLWATMAIWLASYATRLFFLNWANPFRMSWIIGDEAALTLLPEDAVRITIPTQLRWRPGQFVYLRMPGISILENHPFTIASICSDDMISEYGKGYRDMSIVFRPYGGFTKRVLETALDRGPWHTYHAFVDGPYGGMRRRMDAFDHVVLIAGGSGITALISQLLDLIKRMRDGKAVTKSVNVIWAMKRQETMEWFREELRICRDNAPVDSVTCQFFITSAKRNTHNGRPSSTPGRPLSTVLHGKVDDIFHRIASNRYSTTSSKRDSEFIRQDTAGDPRREKELRAEIEDRIKPLPEAHLRPFHPTSKALLSSSFDWRGHSQSPNRPQDLHVSGSLETPHMPPHPTLHEKRRSRPMSLDIEAAQKTALNALFGRGEADERVNFGFPSTPTEFQKNLMRFAFMPAATRTKTGSWTTEWGRPAVPYMLREMSKGWSGRRTCVFVCGPPAMREDVSTAVADLQRLVWQSQDKDEIFLHAENYAL